MFCEYDLNRLENKDSEDVVIDDDRELEEERTSNGQTFWEINQIVASMPVDMNFAKKETVIELLEYLIRLSKKQTKEWQDGPSNTGKEAPISDNFLFFVGDGDPIKGTRAHMKGIRTYKVTWNTCCNEVLVSTLGLDQTWATRASKELVLI